jgi:hypothetical protein
MTSLQLGGRFDDLQGRVQPERLHAGLIERLSRARPGACHVQVRSTSQGGSATSLREAYRRTAYYVDRILKGAKPADLPVKHPPHSSWSSTSRPPKRWA